jgi:pyridoxamine 5'-phosphate oxidase
MNLLKTSIESMTSAPFIIFAAMSDITQTRKDYAGPHLELTQSTNPLQLLQAWIDEAYAAGIDEPNAMALATVDPLGQPSCRMVLLRGLSERGLEFYTNYTSRKAVELADNGQVALLFFWSALHRQVRVEGTATFLEGNASDAYFNDRPREHQIGAWASPQSATIPDRKAIEENVARYQKVFEGKEVPRPSFWGGYRIVPQQMEFWQGRVSRLHDRYRFQRNDDGWKMERLAP